MFKLNVASLSNSKVIAVEVIKNVDRALYTLKSVRSQVCSSPVVCESVIAMRVTEPNLYHLQSFYVD